ncbi:helix-turn-helix transcriptional regulator [Sulfuracidifex tepidarius]|uniref:HTH iclR-type domain-containing protein n=1 Tax=Sulfuracidifex tepidarius TaxID=1294262 RepID=A0A510DZA3_9CREN|nr:transcriptional regulator [Sulfuracidifex tepidarius]BBG22797.1 hypothetical protein IC006_0081 [Sulfuracidifex tepidarius]BBG25574.1 hypothetical protein IC007_0079 [Sulfuracidifex tepidarius]
MGGLALFFLLVFSLTAASAHVQVIDQTSHELIIPNNARVISSNVSFSLRGNSVYLSSLPAEVELSYSGGSVGLDENFSFLASVFLPENSDIVYMSSEPVGFSANSSLYNITFYGRNFTLLYYYNNDSSPRSSLSTFYLGGMVVTSITTVALLVLLFRSRVKRVEVSEVPPNELDDKDKMIIDKIKEGNYNLTKIAELTGIPRTTVYRRIRRLIKLGYLVEERKDGKVRYVVKGDGG